MPEKKVTVLYTPNPKKHRVAIYCRVSTCHESQEDSLEQQMTMYTAMVAYTPSWILHDVYADKASGRGTKNRHEFTRMISDCCDGKIDIILTKSVSRFGRNIVDALEAINKLKHLQVDIIFESEGLRLSEHGAEFIITIIRSGSSIK